MESLIFHLFVRPISINISSTNFSYIYISLNLFSYHCQISPRFPIIQTFHCLHSIARSHLQNAFRMIYLHVRNHFFQHKLVLFYHFAICRQSKQCLKRTQVKQWLAVSLQNSIHATRYSLHWIETMFVFSLLFLCSDGISFQQIIAPQLL